MLKISDFGLAREDHVYIKTTDGKLPLRWSHVSVCANAYICTCACGMCIHVCIIMYVCMQCVGSWSVIRILSPDINSQKKAQYAGHM